MIGRHLAFPFNIGSDGRPATPATLSDHIKGEIIQLLLTSPGERPFLPSFGGGLRRMVFERNDDVSAAVAKAQIINSLNKYLGHRISIDALDVTAQESTLAVDLRYRIIATDETEQLRFERRTG